MTFFLIQGLSRENSGENGSHSKCHYSERSAVAVELDDIQATVLRYRPEPYAGRIVS